MALGAGAATPWQMAAGYAVFANGGYRVEPFVVKEMYDGSGRLIARTDPPVAGQSAPRVIDARNAWLMDSMMRDVVQRGTATRARSLKREDLAGKTGTTNDYVDAWFCGYHPDLVAVSWVGHSQPRNLGKGETGGAAALPIWINYMASALEGVPKVELPRPEGLAQVQNGLGTSQDWQYAEYAPPAPPPVPDWLREMFAERQRRRRWRPRAEAIPPGPAPLTAPQPARAQAPRPGRGTPPHADPAVADKLRAAGAPTGAGTGVGAPQARTTAPAQTRPQSGRTSLTASPDCSPTSAASIAHSSRPSRVLTQRPVHGRKWKPPDFAATQISRAAVWRLMIILLPLSNSISRMPPGLGSMSISAPQSSRAVSIRASSASASALNADSSMLIPSVSIPVFCEERRCEPEASPMRVNSPRSRLPARCCPPAASRARSTCLRPAPARPPPAGADHSKPVVPKDLI